MSRRGTGNNNGRSIEDVTLPNNPTDMQDYEDLIRRLKLLSKTQSTFLKGKLSTAASIVSRALVKIRHLKKEDSSLIELETALANLKLEELDVDYTNAEIMLREELSTLSNAVWNPNGIPSVPVSLLPPAHTPEVGGNKSALEAENANLRSLLSEAKSEILAKDRQITELSSSSPAPPAPPAAPSNDPALQAEIHSLNTRLTEKDASLGKKDSQIAEKDIIITDKDNEISKLKKKNDELNTALASGAAGASSEAQRLRAEMIELKTALEKEKAELMAVLEKEKADSKAALEKEKAGSKAALEKQGVELRAESDLARKKVEDEMMDALASEVEAVEKKAAAEVKQLHDKLSKVSGANSKLSSGLRALRRKIADFKRMHGSIKSDVRNQMQDMKVALKEQLGRQLIAGLKNYDLKMDDMKKKYKKEMNERKKLHNQLQELKGNIRVYMRVRPPNDREIEQHGADSQCVTFLEDNEVRLMSEKGREKTWEFDQVFDLQSTQELVYQEVSPLVTSVLDGYNVCIFAYGQTGSGKTFTMNGPSSNRGVNTRALDELFLKCQARSDEWNDSIMVSILEVYNETIRDLLVTGGGDDKLEIRQSEFGNVVTNLTTVAVYSLSDVEQLLSTADRNRSQACTNMNEHSSRSHMMLQVTVVGENILNGQCFRAKMNLVDLAGSERIDKSGAIGVALKEAQNINKSLSALGDVIQARATKAAHIPFRNSTLTYLLQDSLSQDSKTLMFVCISPILYNAEESFCSLNFAARVRTVELGKANKKVVPKSEAAATTSSATGKRSSVATAKK